MTIGKIIGGSIGEKILIRLKSNASVDVGDIVVCEDTKTKEKFFLKIINIGISSLISNQFVEDIAGQNLEHDTDYNLFDSDDRFYKMCEAKILKVKREGKLFPARSLPNYFMDIKKINEEEFDFINKGGEIEIGNLRLGTESFEGIKLALPAKKLISHHMLVVAATGKGKSNFSKVFLSGVLKLDNYASVVFDPHNEYYGGSGEKGLRDHPLKDNVVYFSPRYEKIPGAENLAIPTSELEPDDFFGIVNLSSAQKEAMMLIFREYKNEWIKKLLTESIENFMKIFGEKIHRATFATLKRKIQHALELEGSKGLVFSIDEASGVSVYKKVKNAVSERKIVIVDTSMIGDETEKIVASSILNRVFRKYRVAKQKSPEVFSKMPEVLVVFEEAPRVIGSEVLSEGKNIFERIAREGRKFKVGLCAITQMPSLISGEILSQMNTKVILGLPAPADRNAVINSAAQNIGDENIEIQMLDKGEAIITSPFIDFPMPVKIFLFEDVLKDFKVENPDKKITLSIE